MITRRISRTLSLLLSLTMVSALAAQTPALKVNKNFIRVSSPDQAGNVIVSGLPGAIQSTSPASAYLRNETTKERFEVTLKSDGSFTGTAQGKLGQDLRVYAKNTDGKTSYGTFAISAAGPRAITVDVQALPLKNAAPESSPANPAVPTPAPAPDAGKIDKPLDPNQPILPPRLTEFLAENERLRRENAQLKKELRDIMLQLRNLEFRLQTLLGEGPPHPAPIRPQPAAPKN